MRNRASKILLPGLFGIFFSFGVSAQHHHDEVISRCGTYERDSSRMISDQNYRLLRELNEKGIADFKSNRSIAGARLLADTEVITIPVVVHVISQNPDDFSNPVTNPNISDEQVRSQIQVLNEDFRRMMNTPGYNTDERGADTFIQFALAEYDINGNPVGDFVVEEKRFTGINRIRTEEESFRICTNCNTEEELANLTIDRFPPGNYLNIWVCKLTGGYLGVAQFPLGAGVDGIDTDGLIEKTDGVIIDYRYFGRDGQSNTNRLYSDGRTTTHEVGHWLGLRHIWGDSYCGDDYVDDTPFAEGKNENSCLMKFTECTFEVPNTLKMIENYMDYTPDACMNIFTMGQAERMRTVLETSPLRRELVRNSKLSTLKETPQLTIDLFPNPATEWMQVAVTFEGEKNARVSLYNMDGNQVFSADYPKIRSRYLPILVNTLLPGMYILKVEAGGEIVTKRVVID